MADEKPAVTPFSIHADPLYLSAIADLRSAAPREAPQYQKHSIAVLPFVNIGGGEEGEAFADGISDDIITALSRHSELFVISRTSSFAYKRQATDIKKIALDLGVRYILEGSVRRSGQRLRITAQLIDAAEGKHIWAEKYEGSTDDVFDIQDRVTSAVATATHTELLLTDYDARGTSSINNSRSRELAGRAILRVHEQTTESISEGLRLAEEALLLAPSEPRAHRAIALASLSATTNGIIPFTAENHRRNFELASKAVESAPRDEQARFALGWALSNLGRYEDAISQCKIAIELNPNFANAYGDLGEHYALIGRAEEAITHSEKALKLNPLDPSFFWRRYAIAMAKFILADYDDARSRAQEIVQRHPAFLRGAVIWAASAAGCGNKIESAQAVEHCLRLAPRLTCSNLVPNYMTGFARAEHQEALEAMLRKAGLPE
jgi:TolB-like protein